MEASPTEALTAVDCEQITQTNLPRSSLLRLPAELRNKIFRLVFADKSIKVYPKWDNPRCYKEYTEPHGAITLLQTCRQIHGEAQGLLCSASTFDLRDCTLYGFVRDFGEVKASFVKSIICSCEEAYDEVALKDKGPYTALERVDIFDGGHYIWEWVAAMQRRLDEASGGRVSTKEVIITAGEVDITTMPRFK